MIIALVLILVSINREYYTEFVRRCNWGNTRNIVEKPDFYLYWDSVLEKD